MRPIYSTSGNWEAMLEAVYLYDTSGEWIAWLDGADVYSRHGEYVGYLSADGRVLRKREQAPRPARTPLPAPDRMRPPAQVPLAPSFGDLTWDLIDVFDEDPDIFHRLFTERGAGGS